MRNCFIRTLIECAKKDEKIFLITADLGYSVLEEFEKLFPRRFLNVGIAEQNAVGIAAGLALSGKTAIVYSIVPFVTMRCFEQIRVDVAYQKANVKLVGVGGGLSYGPAGATHHSTEDIAIMRSLPNMTVLCPGDPHEVGHLTQQLLKYSGPTYLRLGKAGEPNIHPQSQIIQIGKAVEVSQGSDFVILTTGNMLESGKILTDRFKAHGMGVKLVSIHTIKPLDRSIILEILESKVPIFSLEEHGIIGGLGSAVSEIIAESNSSIKFQRIGIPDEFCHKIGSQNYLRTHYRLDTESVFQRILQAQEQWSKNLASA